MLRYLDVKNKASNVACRAELGRLPLNITINQKNAHYLDLTRGIADRKKLLKLQISNRKLMIELGIYNQTTIDTRNCPLLDLLIVLNTL